MLPIAGPPIAGGALLTHGPTIAAVGPATEVAARAGGAAERDLGDAILMPGLVDAHCHLEWSLVDPLPSPDGFAAWLRSFMPRRARMEPDDHLTAARLGALRALRAGTTTVLDSGPSGAGAPALAGAGLRGAVHLEAFGVADGEEARGQAAALAERIAALEDRAGPRVAIGLSPHAPYSAGPGIWRALAERDDLAARPWASHLAESRDEERAIGAGEGPLAVLFAELGFPLGRWPGPPEAGPARRLAAAGALRPGLVAAHCVRLEPEDPERLAELGVAVAHCPRSNRALACGTAPLEALERAGAALALGTDSPASGGDYDLRGEARACAAVHGDRAPEPRRLVELITLGGARAAGLEDRVGSLRPGLAADLLALRPAGPVADPHAAVLDPETRVELVAVDGEPLLEGGALARLDEERILTEARLARARLW